MLPTTSAWQTSCSTPSRRASCSTCGPSDDGRLRLRRSTSQPHDALRVVPLTSSNTGNTWSGLWKPMQSRSRPSLRLRTTPSATGANCIACGLTFLATGNA
uniref:Uncharacterized protein n=1 Tax=uncultured marine virus TaxID=186617 RepID=A0A0F7KZU2_9VIRU|nr:hypothetical protein [uncultured marine virus]